jgi:hypothetical protein
VTSRAVDNYSGGQEMPCFQTKNSVTVFSPMFEPLLRQLNPVTTFKPISAKARFNIILSRPVNFPQVI